MTLREWVVRKGLTQKQAAAIFGTTQQNLSKWMGAVTPKIAMMEKISKITKGQVKPLDFLPDEKWAGDARLVKEGLCHVEILSRWVNHPELDWVNHPSTDWTDKTDGK